MLTTQKNTETSALKKILSTLVLGEVAGPSVLATTLAVSYFTEIELANALIAVFGTALTGSMVIGSCQRLQSTCQHYVDEFRWDIIKKAVARVEAIQQDKEKHAEWIKMVDQRKATQLSKQPVSAPQLSLSLTPAPVMFRQAKRQNLAPLSNLSSLPELHQTSDEPRYPTRVRNKPQYFGF